VRILVFHGYLLHGTGSNVYNARLAEALVRAGHEVHLLSQDRDAGSLRWVDAVGDWDGGSLQVDARADAPRATVYRPDIGGLLPVYVADRYEGVEARPFPELSDDEVEAYVERNVEAVRDVVAAARPDVALANHLVMGPAVLARALAGTGVPYVVKVHGSALEYTVKPHPRFARWAVEGLAGASGVLVGSRHTGESLWAAMDDPSLPGRTRLGPPGVDVEAFAPREPTAAREGLRALVARLGPASAGPDAGAAPPTSAFVRDEAEAGRALSRLDVGADRLVVFVGKLIASKGVELLLAAWPLVLRRHPDARLVVVGFGGFREGLERLAAELAAGDLGAARATRAEDGRELPELAAFLDGLGFGRDAYVEAAAGIAQRVVWTGRLDHEELEDLLPAAEALVAPSTFPEAFGMVAAEGAACAALPVVARHSGLAEVSEALAERVPAVARAWLSFTVGPQAVRELGDCLAGWLDAPPDVRRATREAIVAVTRERWSWDGVARTVIAAAEGRLDELPAP
jgi:glycosyltransferase involved in cell wall biosynthesis